MGAKKQITTQTSESRSILRRMKFWDVPSGFLFALVLNA